MKNIPDKIWNRLLDVCEEDQELKDYVSIIRNELHRSEDNERFLNEMFNDLPELVIFFNEDLHIEHMNPAALKYCSLDKSDVRGSTMSDVIGEDGRNYEYYLRMALDTGKTVEIDLGITCKSTLRLMHTTIIPCKTIPGCSAVCISRDITDQKKQIEQLERDVREREEYLRLVVRGAPIILFVMDHQGNVTFVEGKGLEAIGLASEQIVGQTLDSFLVNRPDILKSFRLALEGKVEEVRVDINNISLEVLFSPMLGKDSNPVGVIGIAADVTKKVEAEDALRRSENRLEETQSLVHLGTWELDADTGILILSGEAMRILGKPSGGERELLFADFLKYIHEDDKAFFIRGLDNAIERGLPFEMEIKFVKDDEITTYSLIKCRRMNQRGRRIVIGSLLDVSEQRLLENERDRFFKLTGDMLCVSGFDGFMKQVNPAFERTLGFSEEELLSTPFIDFIHPDDIEMTIEETRKAIEAKRDTVFFRNRYRTRNGGYRWLLWTTTIDFERRVTYSVARDITDMMRYTNELSKAKEEAESANRAKSDFLANMSHELRTPLNSVIGFANILLKNKQGTFNEKDLSYLNRILSNGKHLLDLINDILDLSKVEAGKMELELESVDLKELVEETLEQLEGQAKTRDLELRADLPALNSVRMDRSRLKQVLINLIGNAIKFTHEGSVTVKVQTDRKNPSVPLQIDVIDTGIGIEKEKLPLLFNPFQQADNSTARKYGGTGLGLAISKSMCEMMGFDLSVSSETGKGTTFSIFIGGMEKVIDSDGPVCVLGSPLPTSVDDTIVESLSLKKILVIDDNEDSRLLITNTIEELGCKILKAETGRDGLRLAEEFQPDMITLDLLIPDINGAQVLKELKKNENTRDIPVVVISIVANDSKAVLEGADHILNKPFQREELQEIIRYLQLKA